MKHYFRLPISVSKTFILNLYNAYKQHMEVLDLEKRFKVAQYNHNEKNNPLWYTFDDTECETITKFSKGRSCAVAKGTVFKEFKTIKGVSSRRDPFPEALIIFLILQIIDSINVQSFQEMGNMVTHLGISQRYMLPTHYFPSGRNAQFSSLASNFSPFLWNHT